MLYEVITNGSKADAGVYFYAIEAEGFNNEPKISSYNFV